MLMKKAQRKAGSIPKAVISDKISSYLDGIEQAFGADTDHIQSRPLTTDTHSTQKIERWHETLKQRIKVMKGLKTLDIAMQFVDAFLIHCNYFREKKHSKVRLPQKKLELNSLRRIGRMQSDNLRRSRSKFRLIRQPRSECPNYILDCLRPM